SPGMVISRGESSSAAVASRSPARLASVTTVQSRSSRAATTARPNPREPPVTIATGETGEMCSEAVILGILIVEVNFKSNLSGTNGVRRMQSQDLLTVSEVAERSGFAPSAIRFYDKDGLICSSRTGGGQRRFERNMLRRLAFIRAARNVGLTLDEIAAALLTLPESRTPTRADWTKLSKDWRQRLDDQIAGLMALRDKLDS